MMFEEIKGSDDGVWSSTLRFICLTIVVGIIWLILSHLFSLVVLSSQTGNKTMEGD